MNKFGIRMAVAAVACSALGLSACWADEPQSNKDASKSAPEAKAVESVDASAARVQVAAGEKPAAAPAAAAPAPAPAAAAPAPAAAAPVPAAATPAPAAAAPAPAAVNTADNLAVQDAAKALGVAFTDGRYRDKDGHPAPAVSKDYKVDWGTWQGFRRYHDACHVCHGPNALGSTFAPALADSLKTMDYETFYGIVVGGKQRNEGGTQYIMPAFGEDKNIMCYLDDIYTYIKARSINSEGKGGMPPGRPAGREDISPEAKQAAADCTG